MNSFKTIQEVFDFYKEYFPNSLEEYEKNKALVRKCVENGAKLLKKERGDVLNSFYSFLTELNLAEFLVRKG